jgi:hypothetical protein
MAVDLASLQTELAAVTKAVNAAYSGAEYEIVSGGTKRRLKRQELPVLLARKNELELAISRLEGSGARGPSVGVVIDTAAPINSIDQ